MRRTLAAVGFLSLACAGPSASSADLTIVNDYAESLFTVVLDGDEVVSGERVGSYDTETWEDVADVGDRVRLDLSAVSAGQDVAFEPFEVDVTGDVVVCYRLDLATLEFAASVTGSVLDCP